MATHSNSAALVRDEVRTAPYKWLRNLYGRAARRNRVRHQFIHRGREYVQVLEGDPNLVAKTESEADAALTEIEARTRAAFPGTKMFTTRAHALREILVDDVMPA